MIELTEANIALLKDTARRARQNILEMCFRAGEGRLASALSCTELVVALFHGGILRIDPRQPEDENRDRFIMSKSPGTVGLYPVLADLGFFPKEEIDRFCTIDGMLGPYGGSSLKEIPGLQAVSGSLGHGLGVGAGLALAGKKDGRDYRTVVMLGDGECYEGSIWEAAMFAGHHELDNLVAIIDRNQICTIDFTEHCLRLEPLLDKWRAFGWDAVAIDGHSFEEIFEAYTTYLNRGEKRPFVIIANTIKGKGISALENNPMGHIMIPTEEQIRAAREELRR